MFATMKKLNLILLCFINSVLYSQNQVLTKQTGGVSWQSINTGASTNLRAKRTTNQTIPSGILTTVTFPSEDYDLNNDFNSSTGIFTPPRAGYYVIMASVNWGSSNTSNGPRYISLIKNGTSVVDVSGESRFGSIHSSIHSVIYSDGSDNYTIQVLQGSGSNHDIVGFSGSGTTFIAYNLLDFSQNFLQKRGGGLSFSSGSGSCFRAIRTNSMNIPSSTNTTITYDTEDFDVNNDFDPSTGVFKPSQAGYYVIMASVVWDGTNQFTPRLTLLKNGTIFHEDGYDESISGSLATSIHTIIKSDGTDDYRVLVNHNSSSGTYDVDDALFVAYRLNDDNLISLSGGASWGGGTNSLVRAKRTSRMTITSGSSTKVVYSSEDFDLNGEFNPSTGIFTPKEAGYYVFLTEIDWLASSSPPGDRGIKLVKKTGVSTSSVVKENYRAGPSTGTAKMTSRIHTVVYYDGTSGHSYHVEAWQNSGTGHDIGGSTTIPKCTFTVYKL